MDRDFETTNAVADSSDELQEVIKLKPSSSEGTPAKIWVVASGKGGVGKTFISSSLAICLTKMGHTVTLIDLDLGGANIHTCLGLAPAKTNIRHFFEGTKTLQEVSIATPIPKLNYIQGFWDTWTPTDLSLQQIENLVPEIKKLKTDYVLIDLGAGALECHLELLKHADEKILVSSPEPTSIEKTYRFIESYMCYSLKEHSIPEAYDHMIKTLREHRCGPSGKHFSFRTFLKENSGIQPDYFETLMAKPIRLIINSSRSQANADLGYSMKSVCYKYYDLNIDFTGAIDYDNAVWQSIRSREPVLIAQPFTSLAGQFLTTCKHLIDPKELRAVV